MTGIAFEDFVKGQVIESGPRTVTAEEIVAFAREFDAQPFHTDPEAAKSTFVGTLIASGWHTAAIGMRLLQESVFAGASSMGSPGVTELRWLKPVLPGDTLHLKVAVEDCRTAASRPDRGFVRFAMDVLDQRDERVMSQAFTVIFPRRGATPLPPRVVEPAAPTALEPDALDAQPLPFLGAAELGVTRDLGSHLFTPEGIVAFASAYDPQVFHLDPDAAKATHFGGLCASGWHTAAIWMQRLLATRSRDVAYTAERGPVPMLGPSPGFKDMRWLAPVYAGDTIRYTTELTDKRASSSRPSWGLAFHKNSGVNQNGVTVFEFTGTVFWEWGPS